MAYLIFYHFSTDCSATVFVFYKIFKNQNISSQGS